ncbi:MAG: LacI family transcriptional regulator, partial [Rhodoferax sp.]|nr:LacI family transcriptional regulator [Rhodoferax sp.]
MSIKVVAERAGVSVATVSRVLNDHDAVREETRIQVQRIIDELGYQANHLARNLRTARSGLVLVTVPDLRNPFYGRVIEGISERLQPLGYHTLLCDTRQRSKQVSNHLRLILQRKVDGAICLDPYTVHRSLAEDLHDLPWVACCEYDEDTQVPHVGIDNFAAARDAVSYLLDRGHRRIAMIGFDQSFLFARQRRAGYVAALKQAGVALDLDLLRVAPGLGFDDGANTMQSLC